MYPSQGHCRLIKIDTNSFKSNQFNVSQIRDNIIIFDRGNNWNVLLLKEALIIKKHRPSSNFSLKASKELQLFWLHFNDFIQHRIYSFNIKLIYSLFKVDKYLFKVSIFLFNQHSVLCCFDLLLFTLNAYLSK